jgi:hypothetical protein
LPIQIPLLIDHLAVIIEGRTWFPGGIVVGKIAQPNCNAAPIADGVARRWRWRLLESGCRNER